LCLVPIIYIAIVSSYPSRAERNLIIVLPFLCLLAADACWLVIQRLLPRRGSPAVFALLAILIAAPGIAACVQYEWRLMRPDTRTVALHWIDAYLPAGSRIAREEYTPQVSADRFEVTYDWSLGRRDYSWYLRRRIDYLVLSSNVYSRALGPPYVAGEAGPAFYNFVFNELPLLVEIAPTPDRPGPVIRIYQVPHG